MRAGQPSRTAEHNAFFRALESSRPQDRRLFADPLALDLLSWPLFLAVRLAMLPGPRRAIPRFVDHRWPGVRTSVVARTRLIDDAIAAAIDDGDAQVILLGAGYDTRAHRLPCLRDVTVFEVDHPDTQRAKQRGLARAGAAPRDDVRYVATDFQEHDLDAAMAAVGYRPHRPTIIVWEGVTNYLTEAAVTATLDWCSRAAGGSTLIFTYVHRDVLTDPGRFAGTDHLRATLDRVGERLTFGIDPAALPELLAARGLVLERDIGAADYRALHYGDAARTMQGHEFYRVAIATVEVTRVHEVPGTS